MFYAAYALPPFYSAARTGYVPYSRGEDGVLKLIEKSIQGERNDELFYDTLIRMAPNEQEKEIIARIRDDERKHRRMFRSIYTQLTGRPAPEQPDMPEALPTQYTEGIAKALLGELAAFEKYRMIYLTIDPRFRDWMFEIMTDEIKHAGYYNYLYTTNK
ncbi:ferritin-like domain-containing protein [Paenibacillus athensensis]|uniref:ferritin-like domain-containing protein n=1 Tax=Paenibacillus athensensis TaxID=1967502 RepID=UPI001E2A9548|nr:ferritin-like domain-containing protein [Paenibacillus athensensis]